MLQPGTQTVWTYIDNFLLMTAVSFSPVCIIHKKKCPIRLIIHPPLNTWLCLCQWNIWTYCPTYNIMLCYVMFKLTKLMISLPQCHLIMELIQNRLKAGADSVSLTSPEWSSLLQSVACQPPVHHLDLLHRLREHTLFQAITHCGAGLLTPSLPCS